MEFQWEALKHCTLLKRFAYPFRYLDMIPRFARPVPQLSMITNHMINLIYNNWYHLLSDIYQPWLSSVNLQNFTEAIRQPSAPLDICWGFVDWTVRPVSLPGTNHSVLYNGHKKVHAFKFQSVVAPNGLIANLFGPVEGKRHDSGMLADPGLLNKLQYSCHPNGDPLCVYGDLAYPIRVHV